MASQYNNTQIITDGLIHYLDFANPRCYVSGSNIANNLGSAFNATMSLQHGVTAFYTSSFGGGLVGMQVTASLTASNFAVINNGITYNNNFTIVVGAQMPSVLAGTNNAISYDTAGSISIQGYRLRSDGQQLFDTFDFSNPPNRSALLPNIYMVSKNSTSGTIWMFNDIINRTTTATGNLPRNIRDVKYFVGNADNNVLYSNCTVYFSMFYNRALSVLEMNQIYNVFKGRFRLS